LLTVALDGGDVRAAALVSEEAHVAHSATLAATTATNEIAVVPGRLRPNATYGRCLLFRVVRIAGMLVTSPRGLRWVTCEQRVERA
jgi:hypothetical protein